MSLTSLIWKSKLSGPQQPRCQSKEWYNMLLISVCPETNLVIWFGLRERLTVTLSGKWLCVPFVNVLCCFSPECVSSPAVSIEAVCADDLLSLILYLLVKTEIPNWWAEWANLWHLWPGGLCWEETRRLKVISRVCKHPGASLQSVMWRKW